eukprot:comp122361_c0_seq1/m.49011 comp122361_c0_seq1/g.49011  ORF comp122361_c0_seq1/g.49011 comp122361_c0_seq1/m.49011 type:complete len:231 (-) comp122361_c0_seq1:16-708(-)
MAKRETTEWEDIQRKFGNLPPAELTVAEETIEDMVVESAQRDRTDRLEHMTYDELENEDEDLYDEDEERILQRMRQRRLQELRQAGLQHFGRIMQLRTKTDFLDEVWNTAGVWVVCMLDQEGNSNCALLYRALQEVASKFPTVKFCRIPADAAIPGYPSDRLPTLLVYRDGKVQHQYVGLGPFGGPRLTPDDIEWELAQANLISTDLEESPHITKANRVFINIQRKGGAH